MSPAEFWWNHLTNAQRKFIAELCDSPDLLWGELAQHAFERAAELASMPSWPETPARVV